MKKETNIETDYNFLNMDINDELKNSNYDNQHLFKSNY